MGGHRKPEGERVNRVPRVHEHGTLRWDGQIRGPELPDDYSWCQRTQEWWQTWRESAQAMLMVETDWEMMMETAFLHQMLWSKSLRVDKKSGEFVEMGCTPAEAKGLGSEIRIRLEKMGATIRDRSTLGMRLGSSGADIVKEAEGVAKSSVDYEALLDSEE